MLSTPKLSSSKLSIFAKRLTVSLTLMVAALAAPFLAAAADKEFYEIKELIAARENYEYVRSLMVMMNENRPLQEVDKIVYEVEQYTLIADDLHEVAKIFHEEGPEMTQMRRQVAQTHLLLVAFYIYQKNFSEAMEHFRMAEEFYPEMYEDVELEVETKATRDKGVRNLTRFEMKDVQQFKSWYEGDVGGGDTFEVEVSEDFVPNTLVDVKIKSLDVLATESTSYRLLELANNDLKKQLTENNSRFFRLTLAPGSYEVTNETGTIFAQRFTVSESDKTPFTVFLQPDKWFTLRYAEKYKSDVEPKLYYNGILVSSANFDKMPYGVYELKADRKHFDFQFGKIEFAPLGEGGTEDVTTGAGVVIIPVVEQSTYTLDLGKKGVFGRVFDTGAD